MICMTTYVTACISFFSVNPWKPVQVFLKTQLAERARPDTHLHYHVVRVIVEYFCYWRKHDECTKVTSSHVYTGMAVKLLSCSCIQPGWMLLFHCLNRALGILSWLFWGGNLDFSKWNWVWEPGSPSLQGMFVLVSTVFEAISHTKHTITIICSVAMAP